MTANIEHEIARRLIEVGQQIPVRRRSLAEVAFDARRRHRRTRTAAGAGALALAVAAGGVAVAVARSNSSPPVTVGVPPSPPVTLRWPAQYKPAYLPTGFEPWIDDSIPSLYESPLSQKSQWVDQGGRRIDMGVFAEINGTGMPSPEVVFQQAQVVEYGEFTVWTTAVGQEEHATWYGGPDRVVSIMSSDLTRDELLALVPLTKPVVGKSDVEYELVDTPTNFVRHSASTTHGPLKGGNAYIGVRRQAQVVPGPGGILVRVGEADPGWLERFRDAPFEQPGTREVVEVNGQQADLRRNENGLLELAWEPSPGLIFWVAGGTYDTALAVARSIDAVDAGTPAGG